MPGRKRGKKKKGKRNGQGNGTTNITSNNKTPTKVVALNVIKRHWDPTRWGKDKQAFMTYFQTTVISVLMVAAYAKIMQLDGLTAVTAMVLMMATTRGLSPGLRVRDGYWSSTAPMPRPLTSVCSSNWPASGPYSGSHRYGADVSSSLTSAKALSCACPQSL